jgi:hypothetical protein
MAYNNERYWFRFFHLSRGQGDKLRSHYFYDGIRAMANRDFPEQFVVSIPLTESLELAPICDFIRAEHLEESEYGVFISLLTELETAIVTVPGFVQRLVRDVGGKIEFSFTVIHPDEVDGSAESDGKA